MLISNNLKGLRIEYQGGNDSYTATDVGKGIFHTIWATLLMQFVWQKGMDKNILWIPDIDTSANCANSEAIDIKENERN